MKKLDHQELYSKINEYVTQTLWKEYNFDQQTYLWAALGIVIATAPMAEVSPDELEKCFADNIANYRKQGWWESSAEARKANQTLKELIAIREELINWKDNQ